MPEWTKEQSLAIDGRKGTLLVSAAAGSGKTTVLVERVIRRLTDTENPCRADELVIVTFTRAAAAQMKEKIDAALGKKIAEGGGAWLLRQQLLLQSAKICTIDSFCGDLVRENFHLLGINADFNIIDESENERYSEKAVGAVLSEMYASGDENFRNLVNLISSGGSDASLSEAIVSIYKSISSYPFPQDAIAKLYEPYENPKPVEQSTWGEYVLADASLKLEYCVRLIEDAINISHEDKGTCKACEEMLADDLSQYKNMLLLAREKKWDELYNLLICFKTVPFTRARKDIDAEVKSAVKRRHDKAKDIVKQLAENICVTSVQHSEDMQALSPAVCVLLECVKLYSEKIKEIKEADEALDFNDVEHLALDLLVEKTDEGIKKTALAQSLSGTYKEIMVDEYQDTNSLQDMIFSAVSDDEKNLFFVGDVKQSIYSFRQAMPELFLQRRAAMNEFDGEKYPGKVTLGANFRSRNSITKAVNYVFGQLMSERVGEINYDKNEQLNAKAEYSEHSYPDVEFFLRRNGDKPEPEFVAEYVKKILSSGRMMKDGDTERPVCAGDICILTRVRRRMGDYAAALEDAGIRAMCIIDGEIGGSSEVRIILSLMRVLDNPLQDIPLTAVMLSPVFGFTHDELAQIRTKVKRGVPVYRSVVASADDGNEKCRDFLEKINSIRRIGIGMGAAEFLRRLFDETGIFSISSSMSDPEQREANLWSLLDLAGKFDSSGGCGLSSFLRFIDRAKKSETELNVSETSHAVKIMTVHKSKGLEFGVCILADMSTNLSMGEAGSIVFSREQGIGLLLREKMSGKTMKTLPYISCRLCAKQKDYSEEMRVLYVAMTRAKEMLTIIGTTSKPEEKLPASVVAYADGNDRVNPGYILTASTSLDWLLPVFMRHSDACELRACCGYLPNGFAKNQEFELKAELVEENSCDDETEITDSEEEHSRFEPNEDLARQIRERMNYVYPYSQLCRAVSKKHASGFLDETFDDKYFASSRPAFMNTGGLNAAQKGTLTHRFMQLCNIADADIKSQIAQMVENGVLTQKEAKELNIDELSAFFSSDIRARILASPNIMREKKFAMLMPVTEAYPDLPDSLSGETIVVQGMIDLAFEENGEMVILDYKTDRGVGDMELRERHFEQLKIYAAAIEHCTDYKVSSAYIYSLALKKEIKVF